MRHFKLPLIVTAVVLVLAIGVGIAISASISRSGVNARQRAEQLGQGMGIFVSILIAPFWIYGAAKFGKERREAREAAKKSPRRTRPSTGRIDPPGD